MIRALVSGTLYGKPQVRTSQGGKEFTTAKLKADDKNGATVWCSLIAFGDTVDRLASLDANAVLSVAGRCEVQTWLKDDQPQGGLSIVADELVTLKAKPKRRRQSQQQPEKRDFSYEDFNDAMDGI